MVDVGLNWRLGICARRVTRRWLRSRREDQVA